MDRVYTVLEDTMFRYKCVNINCNDEFKEKGWSQWINCETCGARALPTEVMYRCLKCGALDAFDQKKSGASCHKCGFRIFVKSRRSGTDPDKGGEGAFKMVSTD